MKEFLIISFLISSFVVLALGLLVLTRNKNKLINKLFFYLTVFMFLWLLTNLMIQISSKPQNVLIWTRFAYFTASYMIYFLYYFAFCFTQDNLKKPNYYLTSSLIIPVIVSFFSLNDRMIFSASIIDGRFQFAYGKIYIIFICYTILFLFLTFSTLIYRMRREKAYLKEQLKWLFIGILTASVFATTTDLLLPLINIQTVANFGPIGIIFFVSFTSYSILAHRLFDVRVIIRRTVVYSVLLAFVLGIYSAVIFASASILGNPASMGRQTMIPNLIAAILIAVGFEPLRKYLTRITDKYLFKGSYEPEVVIKQLTDTLVGVMALDEALLSLMSIVSKALRLSHTAVLTVYEETAPENSVRVQSVGYTPEKKKNLVFQINDPLVDYMRQNRKTEVIEEMERRLEDENLSLRQIKRMIDKDDQMEPVDLTKANRIKKLVVKKAKEIEVAIMIPIIVRGKVIGIFAVGPKMSGDSFTDSDLQLLEIISGQTASAIEQARLYEEDQTKSEFVSIASHELLTPTTAIEGYLSMILDEKMAQVDKTAFNYLLKVQSSARRLSGLVKDLLSVSRIEARRIKIDYQIIDVVPVVQNVTEELLPSATKKKLKLTFAKPDKPLPKCLVDPDKLTQIMFNLIGNALKYTQEGSILVMIKTDPKYLKFIVEDTGIGIRKEDLAHLFEKFYRVDNTETVGIVGSGLGLYITKSIVELMNGEIEVESTEWKGSRFIVKLPIAKKSDEKLVSDQIKDAIKK